MNPMPRKNNKIPRKISSDIMGKKLNKYANNKQVNDRKKNILT